MTQVTGFLRIDNDAGGDDHPISTALLQRINANNNYLQANRLGAATQIFHFERPPRLHGYPLGDIRAMCYVLPPFPITPGVNELTLTGLCSHSIYGTTTLSGCLMTEQGLTPAQDPQTLSSGDTSFEIVLDLSGEEGWVRPAILIESTTGPALSVALAKVEEVRRAYVRLNTTAGVGHSTYTYVVSWDETSYGEDRLPPDRLLLWGDVADGSGDYLLFVWPPYDEDYIHTGIAFEDPDYVGKQAINLLRIGHVNLFSLEVRETATALADVPQEAYKATRTLSARAIRELFEVDDRLARTHTTIIAYGAALDFDQEDPDVSGALARPSGSGRMVGSRGGSADVATTAHAAIIGDFGRWFDVRDSSNGYYATLEVRGLVALHSTMSSSRPATLELQLIIDDTDGTTPTTTGDTLEVPVESIVNNIDQDLEGVGRLELFNKNVLFAHQDRIDFHHARGLLPVRGQRGVPLEQVGWYSFALTISEATAEAASAARLLRLQVKVPEASQRARGGAEWVVVRDMTVVVRREPLTR